MLADRGVASQGDPDPDFPTVVFPNPEEPGAMDHALALARKIDADVVIANDPDADRLAVAVPTAGQWRQLTGNEVGALLAEHLLTSTVGDDRLVVTSVVSSSLLSKQAAANGARYAETLTGFKWVVRPGLRDPSARFLFGFEEALGYSVNDVVRDKDGISAAVTFLQMLGAVAACRQRRRDRARTHLCHVRPPPHRAGVGARRGLRCRRAARRAHGGAARAPADGRSVRTR